MLRTLCWNDASPPRAARLRCTEEEEPTLPANTDGQVGPRVNASHVKRNTTL